MLTGSGRGNHLRWRQCQSVEGPLDQRPQAPNEEQLLARLPRSITTCRKNVAEPEGGSCAGTARWAFSSVKSDFVAAQLSLLPLQQFVSMVEQNFVSVVQAGPWGRVELIYVEILGLSPGHCTCLNLLPCP